MKITKEQEAKFNITKDQKAMIHGVSLRILAELAKGKKFSEAYDTVLGKGRFDRLVEETYYRLRGEK